MKIIEQTTKKTKWRLLKLTHANGNVQFQTGQYPYERGLEDEARRYRERGYKCELVNPGVIVEMGLALKSYYKGRSATSFAFEHETKILYETGTEGMVKIIQALQDGRLVIKDGMIYGLFEFQKKGMEVYVSPVDLSTFSRLKGLSTDDKRQEEVLSGEDVINMFKM